MVDFLTQGLATQGLATQGLATQGSAMQGSVTAGLATAELSNLAAIELHNARAARMNAELACCEMEELAEAVRRDHSRSCGSLIISTGCHPSEPFLR